MFQQELGVGNTEWVGYQVCMDLGCINLEWFFSEHVALAGPGAIACLGHLFPGFPYRYTKMCRDAAACRAAVPFLHVLAEHLRKSSEAAWLRSVLHELGLPMPHVNDVEYWLCELRQAEEAVLYSGGGIASQEYLDALDECVLANGELLGYSY